MFLIGLTGGIGTGKSSVSNFLRNSNIPVVDADQIARQVVQPNSKCWKLIRRNFGPQAINEHDNQINRAYLGQVIFNNPEKRKLLNGITHPEIQKRTFLLILYYYFTFRPFVVLDIPLLFESSVFKPFLSYIIVIKCTQDQQLDRIKTRNGFNDEEALQRILSQIPIEEKCRMADIVIDNTSDLDSTIDQTRKIFAEIKLPFIFWVLRFMLIGLYVLPTIPLLMLCNKLSS